MINANTPAANYYVPTPNAAPQPSQVLRSGNPAESEAASFLHRDANLAADKQASTKNQTRHCQKLSGQYKIKFIPNIILNLNLFVYF